MQRHCLLHKQATGATPQEAVARKIDLCGGVDVEDPETAGEQVLREVANLLILEVDEECATLQRLRKLADLGEKKAILGVSQFQVIDEIEHGVAIFRTDPGGPIDCRDDIAVHDLLQEREGFHAKAVARRKGLAVRGVFLKLQVVLGEEGVDFTAPNIEQGAHQREFLAIDRESCLVAHASQSGRAAEEIEEHGFGIVVGVMGEQDGVATVLPSAGRKELVTTAAGRYFDGSLFLVGAALNLNPRDFEGEVVVFGETAHEGGIMIGEDSAELMIEVTENDLASVMGEERVQECHRIATTGDSQQIAPARRKPGVQGEHGKSVAAGWVASTQR